MEGFNVVRCPADGCPYWAKSVTALRLHARVHVSTGHTCRSCGRVCASGEAFVEHYGDGIGCRRKRLFDSEEEEERRSRMRASVPVPHVHEQEAGMDLDLGDQGSVADVRDVPILHLLPDRGGEFDEEQLASLVHADELLRGEDLGKRAVKLDYLKEQFDIWWGEQAAYQISPEADTPSPFLNLVLTKLVCPQQGYSGAKLHHLFDFTQELRKQLPSSYVGALPSSLNGFARALRSWNGNVFLKTQILTNPPLFFYHHPLLLYSPAIIRDKRMIFTFSERRASRFEGAQSERVWLHWVDGEKMQHLCTIQQGNPFIAWGIFYDGTRIVQHEGRNCYPILACPMNGADGVFELVGFVPVPSDDLLREHGVQAGNYALARALVLNQCVFVVLLYGGMLESSPGFVVDGVSGVARNFCALVRCDHVARLELLQHLSLSKILPNRKPACRAHNISGIDLSAVHDPSSVDASRYCHNNVYKERWRTLLAQLNDRKTSAQARKDLQLLGWRPLEPALFHAMAFDGAVDFPEDIHHVGPLGLGLKLLQWLLLAFRIAFPTERCEGHAKKYFFPTTNDPLLLEIEDQDRVTWEENDQVHQRNGFQWVVKVDDGRQGYVPEEILTTDRPANASYLEALGRLDRGLDRMGRSYVRSYSRFDFRSLQEMAKRVNLNQGDEGGLFNRATTLEQVILFVTYILPSILPKNGAFDWISSTFLSYNKWYWNWRRDKIFDSDLVVMERQRYEFKNLMSVHWAQFSKTQLNTAKFHALDHVSADVRNHSVPRYTGSGPGDQRHPVLVKEPFRHGSNKTFDSTILHPQLMESVPPLKFLQEEESPCAMHSIGFRGKGTEILYNQYVIEQVKSLKLQGWEVDVANAPLRALRKLQEFFRVKLGRPISDDTEFSRHKVLWFHSARLTNGIEIFASTSYHGARRHDFVELENGHMVRMVGFIEFRIGGDQVPLVLAEGARLENDARLSSLGARVISETDEWDWIQLHDIKRPVVALPHAYDPAWYFLIRDKHAEDVWE